MRKALLLVTALATASLAQETKTMKIRFTIDGKELAIATLKDNATARDFLTYFHGRRAG